MAVRLLTVSTKVWIEVGFGRTASKLPFLTSHGVPEIAITVSSKYLSNQIVACVARYQRAGDHPKTVSNGRIFPMIQSIP